jgi:hypothetical protein
MLLVRKQKCVSLAKKLSSIEKGIFAIDDNDEPMELEIPSILMIDKYKDKLFSKGKRLFIAGILTDNLLKFIQTQKNISEIELIVKDFTKVFSSIEATDYFLQKGGKLRVVTPTNIIAITVNPLSPNGFSFDSKKLITALAEKISIPIYDLKANNNSLCQ